MRRFLFILLLLAPQPARAEADYVLFYNNGHFKEAIDAGRKAFTSQGLATAARSILMLTRYYTPEDRRLDIIPHAIQYAKAALEEDPQNTEAYLQLAIAYGYRGRITHNPSDASLSKDMIKKALAIDPNNSWALASFAGWHGEVVENGGSLMASIMFGASFKEAESLFERAIGLEPRNAAFHLGYAKMLLRSGKSSFQDTALKHIVACVALPVSSAFEAIVHHECALLGANHDDPKELEHLLDPATTLKPDLEVLWPYKADLR